MNDEDKMWYSSYKSANIKLIKSKEKVYLIDQSINKNVL